MTMVFKDKSQQQDPLLHDPSQLIEFPSDTFSKAEGCKASVSFQMERGRVREVSMR
jgi:hypothetical protein